MINTMNSKEPTIQHFFRYEPRKVSINNKVCDVLSFNRDSLCIGRKMGEFSEISHFNPDDCKLILRPLDDLINEIEHEGEKFVPLVELAKMVGMGKEIHVQITDQGFFKSSNLFNSLIFRPTLCSFFSIGYYFNQNELFHLLHKWQFDLYGFIENGYAVNWNDHE